jgi:CBS-domain-containing membrane protein
MSPVSHAERLASIGGGFLGILLILLVSNYFVGATDATLIVASMGASAVLLFAVPHGRLSQP